MDKEDKVQKYYCSRRGVVDNDKMSIHQGYRTVPKLYVIYNIASKCMKQKMTKVKGKVNKPTNMEYAKFSECNF